MANCKGFTLLEVTVTTAVALIAIASMLEFSTTTIVQSRQIDDRQQATLNSGRGMSQLFQELAATNATGTDEFGAAYVQLVGDPDPEAVLEYRVAEAFNVDVVANAVTTQFSTPIRVFVNADGQLIREQAGQERVVGTGYESIRFQVGVDGAIHLWIQMMESEEGSFGEKVIHVYPTNNN